MFAVVAAEVVGCGGGCGTGTEEERVVLDLKQVLPPHTDARLVSAAEYHGRYYCFLDYDGPFPLGFGSVFYAIDARTHEVTALPSPDDGYRYRDDLFVRRDTLFLANEEKWHFFDTLASRWVECPALDDLVYEDADYRVYRMDNGEFGQVMWFEERRTGHECALEGLGSVCRVADTFFVVRPYLVLSLTKDQLASAPPSMTNHRRAQKEDYYIASYYHKASWMAGDTVYRDPHYTGWEWYFSEPHDTTIVGALVSGGRLLLLVDKPDGMALLRVGEPQSVDAGRGKAFRLQTVKPLGRRYDISGFSARGSALTDRRLFCFQQDAFSMGVLTIRDTNVAVLDVTHNLDTISVQPDDGLDRLLPYLRDHWDGLTASEVRRFEKSNGGTFYMKESIERNGYFRDAGFREGYGIDFYYRRVDTLYSFGTEYCVRESDGRVVSMFVDMAYPEKMPYNGKRKWKSWEDRDARWKMIWKTLLSRLDALCGPHRRRGDELLWSYGPLTIICYSHDKRMLVY